MIPPYSIYDSAACECWRAAARLDPQVVRRLRNLLFKSFASDESIRANISASDQLDWHPLALFRRCDSERDGATKLLFRTTTGMLIESVILRLATGRTSLCVSSQIGCAAACEFCATGKMGIARNLSAAEILDQVLQAGQLLAGEQRKLRNIVFMGMGEPFHNAAAVTAAVEQLLSPGGFHLSPAKIVVSTVGVIDELLQFSSRFPQVHLALSLHSVRQTVRERLVPLARRYRLEDLRSAVQDINRRTGLPVMIEYVLLDGVNDSLDDARELADWLSGLQVHVNLIPYNAIAEAPQLQPSPPARQQAFTALLKQSGFATTLRYSLGQDIAAACGQLVRHENRQAALVKLT